MKHEEIIIHCTATVEGINYTLGNIRAWHLARGWSDVGYHYIIDLEGKVMQGRSIELDGAHCKGHNDAIGVVYIGGLDKQGKAKDTRTIKQKEALLKLLFNLSNKYPVKKITGHNEYAKKACPCFDAYNEYKYLTDGK